MWIPEYSGNSTYILLADPRILLSEAIGIALAINTRRHWQMLSFQIQRTRRVTIFNVSMQWNSI